MLEVFDELARALRLLLDPRGDRSTASIYPPPRSASRTQRCRSSSTFAPFHGREACGSCVASLRSPTSTFAAALTGQTRGFQQPTSLTALTTIDDDCDVLTTGPAHFVPQVHFTERRQSLLQFVTSVCAIVGGVFTVSGLVDALVFQVLSPPTQTKLPALRIPCRQKRRPRPALLPFGTTLQVVTAHCCWSEQGQKVIKKKMELGKFG